MWSREKVVGKWYNFVANTPSYLSPGVQNLFQIVLCDKENDSFIDSHLLDTSCLTGYLCADERVLLDPTEQGAEWYAEKLELVAPFMALVVGKLNKRDSMRVIMEHVDACWWLHQNTIAELYSSIFAAKHLHHQEGNDPLSGDAANLHECLLLVLAALERGLGNLFHHVNPRKKVPSLLRDLLASDELLGLLGQNNIVFLQLLMGSPQSLNLRNLLWHGFVGCGDFDARFFAFVLLFACSSVGRHLERTHSITANNLVPRRWAGLQRVPPKFINLLKEDRLVATVTSSLGLPSNRKSIWLRAISYHQKGNYGQSCVLILPEIEHILRIIYCAVNDRPARLLTAESVVHYTTLDTILDSNDENNHLPQFLGKDLYTALSDVFIEEEGPRIRDRFSHGECILENVSSVFSQHLLSLAMAILSLTDSSQDVMNGTFTYTSYFSLSAVFKRELLASLESFNELAKLLENTTIKSLPLDFSSWPRQHVAVIETWLNNWSEKNQEKLAAFVQEEAHNRTAIPLSNIWRQMMKKVREGCKSIVQYKKAVPSAPLRSRQRATQARFGEFLPFFVRGAQLVLLFPIASILGGDLVEETANRQSKKMRKIVARWADNMASNSLEKRWNELFACTKELEHCSLLGLPIVFNNY